ncbi:MAG: GxxExxY protein [Acidobacteria bacterium]|nr:GxxExxY protein [Acidobacteriota bacterium]
MDVNQVSEAIINAAMKVHSALGPGLLESAYEDCLLQELRQLGLKVEAQVTLTPADAEVKKIDVGLSIFCEGEGESVNIRQEPFLVDVGPRLDLLVEDVVIVELKAVKTLLPIHEAQLLSYLELSGMHLGLLINFNVAELKDGIRRMVDTL